MRLGLGLGPGSDAMSGGGAAPPPVTDRYISPTGNDTNSGTSEGDAWASFVPLVTAADALPNAGTLSCRVLAGTYVDKGIGNIGTSVNVGCYVTVYFDPGCIFTGPTGVDRSFVNVTGAAAWTLELIARGWDTKSLDNIEAGQTTTIQTYDTGTGNGLGMDSSGGAKLIARGFLSTGNVDGWSCHNSNSNADLYKCVMKSCSKSAASHVSTGGILRHFDCRFKGNPGGSTLGVVMETTANSANSTYTRCEFVPTGTVSTERNIDPRGATFNDCRIGTDAIAATLVGSAQIGNFNDCYLNATWDQNRAVNMTRCYGRATIRQRNTADVTVLDHCCFVAAFTGATAGQNSLIYRNFDPGSAGNLQIRSSIISGYTTGIGQAYTATDAGYWAASGSDAENCCFYNNTTNVDADILAAAPGSIISPLNTNPLLVLGTGYDQAAYCIAPGSPCFGAGVGGSNIGFAAGDI